MVSLSFGLSLSSFVSVFFLSFFSLLLLLFLFFPSPFGVLGWALFIEPAGVASSWSRGAGRGAAVGERLSRQASLGFGSAAGGQPVSSVGGPPAWGLGRSVARGTCNK